MATTSFILFVSYSQIVIFDSALTRPFNDWSPTHVDQGFAWREGSVAFATLEEDGYHDIEVSVTSAGADLSPNAVRIIRVPFTVPSSGQIEVASITESFPLELLPGIYALRFECFRPEGNVKPKITLVFTKTADADFAVLRADSELSVPDKLLLTASPA